MAVNRSTGKKVTQRKKKKKLGFTVKSKTKSSDSGSTTTQRYRGRSGSKLRSGVEIRRSKWGKGGDSVSTMELEKKKGGKRTKKRTATVNLGTSKKTVKRKKK